MKYVSLLLMTCLTLSAQAVTKADYDRAASMLSWNTNKYVKGSSVRASWQEDGRFLYVRQTESGSTLMLVDPKRKTNRPAFDHQKMAGALKKAGVKRVDPNRLGLRDITLNGDVMTFRMGKDRFSYQLKSETLTPIKADMMPAPRNSYTSPDGQKVVYIKDFNLYVKDLTSGKETQLTTDGIKDFGYGTNNAGWIKRDGPVLLWSPDSRKIATFQHDGRGVGEMVLGSTKVGHPKPYIWKYPLPSDSVTFRVHRVIIDVESGRMVRLKMGPDQHRSSTSDHIADWDGTLLDAEWNQDSDRLAFLSNTRDHKTATLRLADAINGDVKTIYSETENTFFESGFNNRNWRVLNESDKFIWYSQKSDWGHLYMRDLDDGDLIRQLTRGKWNVLEVLHVDEDQEEIYFTGVGREKGDPYFQYLYKVGFNGRGLKLLSPGTGNHQIQLNVKAGFFIDRRSTPTDPGEIVLRDLNGRKIMELEKGDISELLKTGWKPPIPFTVKARDNKTNLYGLMYRPSNFDPNKKYPVLNYLYPGPQTGSVGSRSFRASRGDKQALAELGFIVVEVDAMGTPLRSKSFHAAYYGNMGDNGLPDQVSMIKQLGQRHSYFDMDRIGIYGHSGGGYASTRGILEYPDFYKVAVSGAGNHDNRNYEDDWGEKWQGLLKLNEDGSTTYDNQANHTLAKNLKGKLLLCHGTLDTNVPPYNTLLVVKALIEANKDFDMIMFPNRGHGLGLYYLRKRWDYFVTHLLNTTPPKEYELTWRR